MSIISNVLTGSQRAILGSLLVVAAIAWVFVLGTSQNDMARGLGDARSWVAALAFLGAWVVMMAAMMFPAAAPMVLMFAAVSAKRKRQGRAFVPVWVFVAGYLAVWAAFGMVAYGMSLLLGALSMASPDLGVQLPRLGGVALLLAGAYQFTPFKRACLTQCRTPLDFVMRSWREGVGGALVMGLEHGAYCLGCCWLLFVALFPLGLMNIAAMALVTALVFAEKTVEQGLWVGKLAGTALVAYGVLVLVDPILLPTMMPASTPAMSSMPGM